MYIQWRLPATVAAAPSLAVMIMLMLAAMFNQSVVKAQTDGQTALRINEYMSDNRSIVADPAEPSARPDWVEIYNPTAAPVNLDGLFLTDQVKTKTKYAIPNGLSIPAGGFIVFFADNQPNKGPLHTNFILDAEGEYIGLYGNQGQLLIDGRVFGKHPRDVAEGRFPDGSDPWRYLTTPTPNAANGPVGPIILNVTHSPEYPVADAPTTVSAVIADDNFAEVQATLIYSTAAGGVQNVEMVNSSSLISGAIFTGEIPAQAAKTYVYYRITTTDGGGSWASPAAGDRFTSYFYLAGYTKPTLVINEYMSINLNVLEDPVDPGEFPDWIELYNYGSEAVSLDSLSLSDNLLRTTAYLIPNGLSIPAGGYLVFYADGEPEQGATHTNFKFNDNGESVGLFGLLGREVIDTRASFILLPNVVEGRFPDGTGDWSYSACPSPGAKNELTEACALPQVHLPVVVR